MVAYSQQLLFHQLLIRITSTGQLFRNHGIPRIIELLTIIQVSSQLCHNCSQVLHLRGPLSHFHTPFSTEEQEAAHCTCSWKGRHDISSRLAIRSKLSGILFHNDVNTKCFDTPFHLLNLCEVDVEIDLVPKQAPFRRFHVFEYLVLETLYLTNPGPILSDIDMAGIQPSLDYSKPPIVLRDATSAA